jgi:hypothetical protein
MQQSSFPFSGLPENAAALSQLPRRPATVAACTEASC